MKIISPLFLSCLLLAACAGNNPPPAAPIVSGQPTAETPMATSLRVTCDFPDGWAAVVPRSAFSLEDEYTMQALIGMAEEPEFWGKQTEYSALTDYPARRCSDGATFDQVGSDYVLLIGRANTYDGDGYGINGVIRDADAGEVRISADELDMSWPCISCPRVYVWNGRGWELRGEVLIDVIGAGAEKTQRRSLGLVRVEGGEVRLRLAEEEDEVSHVDALLLEVAGVAAVPATTELAAVDGARTVLARGDSVELRYQVALPDGEYEATAVATGYYVPLASLR